MKLNQPGKLLTHSKILFDIINPTHDHIEIEDIAHALSNLCRWGGQCPTFYSVAQHSVACSYLVDPEHALEALMHDASEAYMVDLPSTIKALLPDYTKLEENIQEKIFSKYNLSYPFSSEVHDVDKRMLHMEYDQLIDKEQSQFSLGDDSPTFLIMDPTEAKRAFLFRFNQLVKERKETIFKEQSIGRGYRV